MARQMGVLLGITLFATGVGALASLVALGPLGPFVALKILVCIQISTHTGQANWRPKVVGAIAAIGEKMALINYTNRSKRKRHSGRPDLSTDTGSA